MLKMKVKINNVKALEGDVENSLADMSLTNEKLNWNAKVELQEGLRKLICE